MLPCQIMIVFLTLISSVCYNIYIYVFVCLFITLLERLFALLQPRGCPESTIGRFPGQVGCADRPRVTGAQALDSRGLGVRLPPYRTISATADTMMTHAIMMRPLTTSSANHQPRNTATTGLTNA